MSRSGARRPGSPGHSRGALITRWTAAVLTSILVAGLLTAYVKYRQVFDSINQVSLSGLGQRPPKFNDSLNVLVIGSDSRSGKNGAIGGFTPGQRSDTVMVVHISPGQRGITVLSFPRDTVVPILACPKEPGFAGQLAATGYSEQLNSTFANGGPNCLLHTLEQVTQVRLDDFVQLNFTGFISVINALGGVEVCLPYAIHPSYYDKLNLPAGPHLIKGYQALEYWRLREGFGLGSDLQRIQRDQLLMVSLVQKILSSHVLSSISKTTGVITSIVDAHALTIDTGLTPGKLITIATGLSGLSAKTIQFIEVPTVADSGNANWVAFDTAQDPALFADLARDIKLPKITKSKPTAGSKKSTAPALLSPAKVSVEVLNGSGVAGVAGTTATALKSQGFNVLGVGPAATFGYTKSVVQYGSAADLAAAQTIASRLDNVTLRLVSTVQAGTVNLVLGSTFKTVKAAPPKPVGNLTQQVGGYTATTNICKNYGSAFLSLSG